MFSISLGICVGTVGTGELVDKDVGRDEAICRALRKMEMLA